MLKYNIPFNIAYIMNKNLSNKQIEKQEKNLTYGIIFKNILENKYYPIKNFQKKKAVEKDRRVHKLLNLFFYVSLAQISMMNLCVFVFFNWDIMEPITQCITYLNIICGYYYWVYSNGGNYEISYITSWLKSRRMLYRYIDNSIKEKNEIIRELLYNLKESDKDIKEIEIDPLENPEHINQVDDSEVPGTKYLTKEERAIKEENERKEKEREEALKGDNV